MEMVDALPKHVLIQSAESHTYLQFDKENSTVPNALQFTGEYSYDINTRFEVVHSTAHPGLIHIRSLQNSKYWAANYDKGNNWITAMAIKPEENMDHQDCTLFRPAFVSSKNNRDLKLIHCSTRRHISTKSVDVRGEGLMCLTSSNELAALFTFIDWKSVVTLPNIIRIKGDNGNYLKAYEGGFMDYRYKDDNSSLFDYEVYPSRDGGIRLKSVKYGTYWTNMGDNGWVWLRQASATHHETNTVFKPMIVKDNRIFMKSLEFGKYCCKYSTKDKTNCLAACLEYPDEFNYMEIEEPVLSRTIDNVRYRLTDARLYDEKKIALITNDSSNKTNQPLKSELNLKTTVTNTTNWSTNSSWKVGVKEKVTVSVPLIVSGELEVSAEYAKSSSWGETETKTIEVGNVVTVTVPPMTRVKGSLMATRVSYDIPFTYTQYDDLKDGSTKVFEKKDGIFTGHNGYDYKYEIVELPL